MIRSVLAAENSRAAVLEEVKLDKEDGNVFEIPIPIQILLSLTDCYAKDLCNVLDGASSRDGMTAREEIRYLTAIYSIDFNFFHKKKKAFTLPRDIPNVDRFFSRLVSSKRLQVQVATLLRHRDELFAVTEEQTTKYATLVRAWLAVRRQVIKKLDSLSDGEDTDYLVDK